MSVRANNTDRITRTRSQTPGATETPLSARTSSTPSARTSAAPSARANSTAKLRPSAQGAGGTTEGTTNPRAKQAPAAKKSKNQKVDSTPALETGDGVLAEAAIEGEKTIATNTVEEAAAQIDTVPGDARDEEIIHRAQESNEMLTTTPLLKDNDHLEGVWPTTNAEKAGDLTQKRKSEASESETTLIPGQNQFAPLVELTEPPQKRARSESLEDQGTEVADEDDDNLASGSYVPEMDYDDGVTHNDHIVPPTDVRALTAKAPKALVSRPMAQPPARLNPFAR
ncbi:hypothetical protein EDD18DRAFT_1351948 [Armillaria luteobubalina]|uniref:Uncharacterized protein n=1 Tax=Armillaria luteobubalina TaxID=153913 RepID=A0AA39TPW6_9AGAR|nr:hypothetical protein EDD18DRAFT_1351948 [Armillaria luteobubalina]